MTTKKEKAETEAKENPSSETLKNDNQNENETKEKDETDELIGQLEKVTLAEESNEDSSSDDDDDDDDGDSGAPTLKTIARWIKEGAVSNIFVLSGAGVSCAAGIPDFRTPGTGLYDNLQKYNLPYPEAIFEINFYRKNPKPFVALASQVWPGLKHSPTLTHSFVALLDRKGLLMRNYTQNIDGLEALAGVDPERLVECHGHFRSASCIECGKKFDGQECQIEMVENIVAPRCKQKRCKGLVKPDIVFFGEGLPSRFGNLLRRDLSSADLMIVMGTSLNVTPVSLIPKMLPGHCPRLLVNRELVGDFADHSTPHNRRDAFEAGDCDDTIIKLCKYLGWEEELYELNASTKVA